MALEFSISAKNSSGVQRLIFDVDHECLYACLYGVYEGKDIQIDFDGMNIDEVNELIRYLELKRKKLNEKLNVTEKK